MNSRKPICSSYSSLIPFIFFGLVVFLNTTTISPSYNGNKTDHLALLSFKSLITQDPYGALSSWNSSFHFCYWSGVSCGKRHNRVTSVRLHSRGLVGSLSPQVGNLSFLRHFSLWNNSFQGNIPHELGRLFRLKKLDLGINRFNGVIPTNMSGCSSLESLVIYENKVVGNIPIEVSFLSKLILLMLEANNLTGGIPPFLGNLTLMEEFYASYNPLGGRIPDTLDKWKNLRMLSSGTCNLYGIIPHSVYNLSLLTNLYLVENHLTGSLPQTLGTMLPHLKGIFLYDNQLSGLLPPSISNCSKLKHLETDYNNFSGKLTIDFSTLKDITSIMLGINNFVSREANEMKFFDSFKNCSKLKNLGLFNYKFQGVLPNSIGNFSNQLSFLYFEGNQMYGNLPSSIGNLINLTTLYFTNNQFTGKIPSTICKLQNLKLLDLSINQFSGQIPNSIGNLSSLMQLDLSSNILEGNIPSSLGNCHLLYELHLHENKLTGNIPKQLLELSSLSITLSLSQNNLSGSLPIEVGLLKNLNLLDLSDNKISGNIPSSLSECDSLVSLYLKGNLFQGMIPQSLSSMRGVMIIDLSHNSLSGQIPKFLEQLSLEYLNLSFNDLEGEVPMKGVFTNGSAFSVFGNNRICGGLVELGLPKCKEMKKHKKRFTWLVIAVSVTCIPLAVLSVVYSLCKKKNKGRQSQSLVNERFLKVSYNQLLKATNGFSEANMIGKGAFSSVYKGNLDHDNRFVAIKVLHLQIRGADKSFMVECEAWRSIRHQNLLKIITSCSSVDFQGNEFKALVYEFMPKGSLDDWLHSSASTSRLNLLQRINILMDVACALDYLHNHCQPAIVHCDLKPSNILLDDDMVAHVGDFGLSRFLLTDSNQNSSTGIKGTVGYAAPEYAFGSEMTKTGDVYSFGILLLEVMTGKNPTDDIFNEGFNLCKLAYMALPDRVTDVVVEELGNFHQQDAIVMQNTTVNAKKIQECLTSVVRIGVACSVDFPSDRMNIENVVHELQRIQDMIQNMNIFEV